MQAPSKQSLAKDMYPEMPRILSHQSIMTGSESDSSSSSSPTECLIAIKSPKVDECRSMRSPRSKGKKNVNKMAELESQLSQLQEDLNRSKDQLALSKLQKRRAQKESEEARKDSEPELKEISKPEGEPVNELLKIGQEREEAWQSELEAIRKQQPSALVAAVDEVRRLRIRCEMLASSEAAQAERAEKATSELQDLKLEMAEKSHLFENLRSQVEQLLKSEVGYRELIDAGHLQLEMAKETIATQEYERAKLSEALNSTCSKLDESTAQVTELEERVRKMKAEMESEKLASRHKLASLMSESEELRSALVAAETGYQEEQIKSVLHVQSAYEAAEAIKIGSGLQICKLESLLKEANSETDKLKTKLIDRENTLHSLRDLNERLNSDKGAESESKLKEAMVDVANLKTCLVEREGAIQSILEENSSLRSEMEKQVERCRSLELAKTAEEEEEDIDVARAAGQEAEEKLDMVAQVFAERNTKGVATLETDVELHRLKVQMLQWRKAAEMAMAVLSHEDPGKMAWRTVGSFESNSMNDDEQTKKRISSTTSSSMFKRWSVLRKKYQK